MGLLKRAAFHVKNVGGGQPATESSIPEACDTAGGRAGQDLGITASPESRGPADEHGARMREEGEPLELEVADAFQRLMTHGLAAFHGLQSFTTDEGLTFVRRMRTGSCW